VCGDLNALPFSYVCRRMGRRLTDAQKALDNHRPRQTWFGAYPAARIDHVFFGQAIEVLAVQVASTALARLASDHLPLIVDLRLL
jgi:endonuclease/exonuclease/phosphatase family metal-dependent hydrolase